MPSTPTTPFLRTAMMPKMINRRAGHAMPVSGKPIRFIIVDTDQRWAADFGRDATAVCRTQSEVERAISLATPDSVWISRTDGRTEKLAKALVASIEHSAKRKTHGRLLAIKMANASLLPTLQRMFIDVAGFSQDFRCLSAAELSAVLRSDASHRRDVFIGGHIDRSLGAALLVRGTFEQLLVPLTLFRPSGKSRPDFKRFELSDYGHTLRFGDYEATTDSVLWDMDPHYRARIKARERCSAKGFGPSLRRLRKQRGLLQSDFPRVARKTISRIEKGAVEKPHGTTLARIAKTLGVEPDEIETY
jgi:DNA-binding XRE family transcriptional regulator